MRLVADDYSISPEIVLHSNSMLATPASKMASFEVNSLSDVELRSKLAECGHPVGPVTETTRKILIKKLKLLMKAKNSVKNSNRNLSRFSPSDESESDTDQNGGKRHSRRISMPPPSSYKTTRRKSNCQNTSPSTSPVPSSPKISSSTPISSISLNPDAKISKFFTPSALKQTRFSYGNKPSLSTSHSYEIDSVSDSDDTDFHRPANLSFRRKYGPAYGTLSSYRSRLNNSQNLSASKAAGSIFFSKLRNENKKESRPFLSNFVGRFSRLGGLNDSVNPQDIKENDFDDYKRSERFLNMNIASRGFNLRKVGGPFKTFYENLRSKDNSVLASHWITLNNSQWFSRFLLGLFLLFFLWLILAYFRVTQRPSISGKTINYDLLCADLVDEKRLDCIKSDLPYAIRLYKHVHLELQAQGLRSLCGPFLNDGSVQKPFMTQQEVTKFLKASLQLSNSNDATLSQGIKNLKLLILSNKHWGISLIKQSDDFEPTINGHIPYDKVLQLSNVSDSSILFICSALPVPWTCYIIRVFYKILHFIFMIILIAGGMYVSITGIKHYRKTKKEEHEQVMNMVERILEFVSENAEKANLSGTDVNGSISSLPSDYIAVRHVHDTLIHPTERQSLSTVWQKAVKFIEENESRIRTEIQQVWGEDATVWRWLGPPLNKNQTSSVESNNESNHLYPDLSHLKTDSRKSFDRVWQGEAFETSEGSMNALPSSFTQCLKIRHMFKHDRDYGPDWVMQIRDAIVEKCEGAKIVHLSVDQDSTEGCVYVKCASQKDAGLAYRQLHGSWFDGALITVKYLRLERYHERFPDSVYATVPLRPSNNLRLSLQGSNTNT